MQCNTTSLSFCHTAAYGFLWRSFWFESWLVAAFCSISKQKPASVAAQQRSLCSPDPSHQSFAADFFLSWTVLTPRPPLLLPLFVPLSAPLPSSLYFLLCHCSSCSVASVVRGNTPKVLHLGKHANLLPFQPSSFFLALSYSLGRWTCQQSKVLLNSLFCDSVCCISNEWINCRPGSEIAQITHLYTSDFTATKFYPSDLLSV